MDQVHEVGASQQSKRLGFSQRISRGVYGSFYSMRKRMTVGKRFLYVSTLVMMAQLLYFPISSRGQFHWNPCVVNNLTPIAEALNYGFYNFSTENSFYALVSLSAAAIVFMLLGLILLASDELSNTVKYQSLTVVLEISLRLFQTVLLVPTSGLLVRVALCSPDELSICGTAARAPIQILGVAFMVCFAVMVLLNATLMVTHTNLDSTGTIVQGKFAAPHGRVELLATFVRGGLACALAILPTDTELPPVVQTVWMLMQILASILLTGAYMYTLPYLDMSWNKFSVACYGVFFWSTICLMATHIIDDSTDYAGVVLFIGGTPVVVFALGSLVELRIHNLISPSKEVLLLNPYTVEVRLRLLYAQSEKKEFVFNGEIEQGYRTAFEAFPSSAFLRLYVAELCSSSKRVIFSLNLIREAKDLRIPFDTEFLLFCLNKRNLERQNDEKGAASFMAFDTHLREAKEKLISTLRLTALFWKYLSKGHFTISQLISQGAKIHLEAQQCKNHISKLLKISSGSPEAMRLYSTFVHFVMNDQQQATKILSRVTSTAEAEGGYAVATVSGNMASLGKVIDVTQATCDLFGYHKNDLIGQNISCVCPPPFDRIHDMMLKQFLSIDADFETKTRRIFGIHSEGYLLPVDFVITPSTNANSDLIFIGKFALRDDPTKHILLVDSGTNLITSCTRDSPRILGIDMSEIYAMNVHILDAIPDFFEDDQGNSKYFKNLEATVNIGKFVTQVSARKMNFDSRAESSVSFSCGVILVTLKVVSVLSEDSEDESSAAGSMNEDYNEDVFDENHTVPITAATPRLHLGGVLNGVLATDKFENKGSSKAKSKTSPSIFTMRTGGKSQGSQGSSITETTELTIGKIHRMIESKLRKKDPRVMKFGLFIKVFTIVFILFSLCHTGYVISLYDIFLSQLGLVALSHHRTHSISSIATIVEYSRVPLLNISAIDASKTGVYSRILPIDTRSTLQEELSKLRSIHADLVRVSVPALDLLVYLTDMNETLNGVDSEHTSYHFAALKYMGHLENYIETDAEECLGSCKYILNNGMFELFDQSLIQSNYYQAQAVERINMIDTISRYSIMAILVFLLAAFVYGFVPMFKMTQKRKESLGKAFVHIPTSTMKSLHKRAERRIRILQDTTATQEFDDGMEEKSDDEDSFPISEELPLNNKNDSEGLRKRNSQGVFKYVASMFAKVGKAKISPEDEKLIEAKPQRRVLVIQRETRSSRFYILLTSITRVASIFWVVLIFFVVMSVLDLFRCQSILSLNQAVFAAGFRNSNLFGLHFWSSVAPQGTQVSGFRQQYNLTLDKILAFETEVITYDRALKFGDTSIGVEAFKATEGEQYHLYFEDICEQPCLDILNNQSGVNIDMAKDMQHGMVLTMERYLLYVTNIVKSYNGIDTDTQPTYEAKSNLANLPLFLVFGDLLDVALENYIHLVENLVAATRSKKILISLIFVLCMITGYWSTLRAFQQMERELKDAQSLLYMLPLEVFEDVPELHELIQNE